MLFSVTDLLKEYKKSEDLKLITYETTIKDIENALLYLSKIGSLQLEGGFLVLYNAIEIIRLNCDNHIQYKNEDYRNLNEFYKQKIRQIHIVGEYANLMVKDYNAALSFVYDYFHLNFNKFIAKYFDSKRSKEIERNILDEKINKLYK